MSKVSKITSYINRIISQPYLRKISQEKSNKIDLTSLCGKELQRFQHKMNKPNVLLLSASNVHGYAYLEYASNDIQQFFTKLRVSEVLFIPYAVVDYDSYLKKVQFPFEKMGLKITSIHEEDDPIKALQMAQGIFIGGGNTFLLLKTLYQKKLIDVIRERVLIDGIPYMGSSAGTNVACYSINNTNDMPIVYPPTFKALELVPFNINPHFLDHDQNSTHKGETREERIMQYHELPDSLDVRNVIALREGSHLLIEGDRIVLKGLKDARLYLKKHRPREVLVGTDLSFLKRPNPELVMDQFLHRAAM